MHLEQKDTDEIDSVVINTITIDGVPFTNDDLLGNKYIMFLNWATWCPDCDNFINNLYLNSEQIKESDIRVIGLPYYDESTDLRELSKEVNKVLKQNTVEFTNIVCTKEMSEFFQTSIDNIPSVIIMDNKGHVIAKDSTELISIQDLLNAVEEYSSCNEC